MAGSSYEITEWVGPDGSITNFMDLPNIGIQPGRTGAFMPPIRQVEETVPYRHGTRIKAVSYDSREIDLPIRLKQDSEDELRLAIRALLTKLRPTEGDGRLRVTRPDGTAREVFCRYSRGLELVEDSGSFGIIWQRAIVTFRATNPLWYDVTPVVITYQSGSVAPFFPGTPFRLTNSGIFTSPAPIVNDGDVEAWPIWTIQGPASNIVIRNVDTGEKLEFLPTFSLLPGEGLVIDTRERYRQVNKYLIDVGITNITNISVVDVTGSTVDVSWVTDRPADSKVEWGISTSYGTTVYSSTLVTNHTVRLTGLPIGTEIFFRITSVPAPLENVGVMNKEYKSLTQDSTLWAFSRGSTNISLEMTGTDPTTLVTLTFNRGYLSA